MQLQNSPAQVTQGATPAQNTVSGYGGASGRGWDLAATVGTGCTVAYDSTHSIQPNGSDIKIAVGSTAASAYVVWAGNLPPLVTSYWFRQVLYFTGNPSATMEVCLAATASKMFDVVITSAGKIAIRDSTSTIFFTTTNTIPLNTRFRIEGQFTPGTGTNGQVSISLYATEFAAAAEETGTTAATMNTLAATPTSWRWGQGFTGNANLGPWWMSGMALSNTGAIGPGAILQHMVAGAPTQNEFTVVSRTVGATSCRLKVATNSGMTQNVFYIAAQTPDQYGYVTHLVPGLTPHTQYYVQVTDTPTSTGTETAFGPAGACKTLPAAGVPASFTVSFASCIATADTVIDPTTAMTDWAAWNADIKVFTGDFDYFDPTYTDVYSQIGVFESQIHQGADQGAGAIQQMLATGWGFYCTSDHETGPDNGDSNTTYMPPNIAARQEIFPQATLGDLTYSPVHGLYQSWTAGRVRFILYDIRNTDRSPSANTDNSSKTMLGATQLAWFYNQLLQPEPLKVLIGDTQWMGNFVAGQLDKWWSYSTERSAIISFIQANQARIGNVMLWHGDFHGLGCTPGANNSWGGFPVYCAAPICQTGAAVQDTSTFTQMYNNSGGECRFYGRVTFTDDGHTISVNFQGWDAVNQTAQVAQTDTFSCPPIAPARGGLLLAAGLP